jgi:hypothetical protein
MWPGMGLRNVVPVPSRQCAFRIVEVCGTGIGRKYSVTSGNGLSRNGGRCCVMMCDRAAERRRVRGNFRYDYGASLEFGSG